MSKTVEIGFIIGNTLRFLEGFFGRVHLRLLDAVTGSFGQSFTLEVYSDGVYTGVSWPLTFDNSEIERIESRINLKDNDCENIGEKVNLAYL